MDPGWKKLATLPPGSFPGPCSFYTDIDPRLHTRTGTNRLRILILPLSSTALKMPTKISFSDFFAYYLKRVLSQQSSAITSN
jgi:hypothetical protein